MKIDYLLKRQKALETKFQNEFIGHVRRELLKNKLDAKPEKIVKKIAPKYIKAAIQLGVDWINK